MYDDFASLTTPAAARLAMAEPKRYVTNTYSAPGCDSAPGCNAIIFGGNRSMKGCKAGLPAGRVARVVRRAAWTVRTA